MRTPMPPPPFLQRSDHRDLLAAQALLQAMEPGWEVQTAAHSLARAAAGDQAALHRALARIQLRSSDRATPVTERAAQALRLTLNPPASTTGGGR
jgi:hypothetical protein